jgi:hypothetical protein
VFGGAPNIFSPDSQTIRAAQDSTPVSLFDGAALIRVPYQVPAGVSGVFQLVFGTFNQLTDATATPLPLQMTDTGSITITAAFPLGDYNHSGAVESGDYATWRSTFGSTSSLNADGNGNNIVDAADYVIWRNQSSPGSAVSAGLSAINTPEPSTLHVVCASVLVILLTYPRSRAHQALM